jgi:hypothetical protein
MRHLVTQDSGDFILSLSYVEKTGEYKHTAIRRYECIWDWVSNNRQIPILLIVVWDVFDDWLDDFISQLVLNRCVWQHDLLLPIFLLFRLCRIQSQNVVELLWPENETTLVCIWVGFDMVIDPKGSKCGRAEISKPSEHL